MPIGRVVPAVALGFAVVVIVVAPGIIGDPNAMALPSAAIVAIGCAAAASGGRWGRRVAMAVTAVGLLLSGLWLWFALDGFGKGTPWWDDVIEAAILGMAFLVALLVLLWARRDSARKRVSGEV